MFATFFFNFLRIFIFCENQRSDPDPNCKLGSRSKLLIWIRIRQILTDPDPQHVFILQHRNAGIFREQGRKLFQYQI